LQYQQEAYYTVISAVDGWYVQRYETVGDMVGGGMTEDEMAVG
jgi:hypothetical protein